MKKITFTFLFLFGLILSNYAGVKDTITIETFGVTQYGTGSGDNGNGVYKYTQGWGAPTGAFQSWRFDKVTTLTNKNGKWMGGSDSTCRIVTYAAGNTIPPNYTNPSKGCQLLLTNRMPNYAGSWDTAVFADINIADYVVTSINFGYAKNANLFINDSIACLAVQYRIDGGSWVQMDSTKFPKFASGVFKYIEFAVPEGKGAKMDVRFIGLKTAQTLIDDVAVLGNKAGKGMTIENIVYGKVDNPADFTATVAMNYDLDSVYMLFNVTDDSIVNKGQQYQVDNIEVYFDMDNSKNVHWPRNGGWVSGDATYDANDWQFRLVPDSAFKANNPKFTGARQVYKETETGYSFQLNVDWTSLKPDFAQVSTTLQVSGTLIGFDVLISDNDAVASNENRNQITYNSSTDKAFNDPSLWGTLSMLANGLFKDVPDVTAPTIPSNVAAEVDSIKGSITLTWDPSKDNTAIMSYTVTVNSVADSVPVLALKEGNKYVLKDLKNGNYRLLVSANDNNGNKSDNSPNLDVKLKIVIVDTTSIQSEDIVFSAYPNPVTSLLYINKASTIESLQIIGINGSVIATKSNYGSELISYDASNLAKGLYIVKIKTINGKVTTCKLIKE